MKDKIRTILRCTLYILVILFTLAFVYCAITYNQHYLDTTHGDIEVNNSYWEGYKHGYMQSSVYER